MTLYTKPAILSRDGSHILHATKVFPPNTIIPIAPHDAIGFEESGRGKVPAKPGYHQWVPLLGWQNGCDKRTLMAANAAGANAGVRCGINCGDGTCLVAIDIDTVTTANVEDQQTQRALLVRQRIILTLEDLFGPIWVRQSIGGRGATFVRMPIAEADGVSRVIALDHPWFEPGNLEIRGRGKQQVVAGIHRDTHQLMTWFRSDKPEALYRVPTDASFPNLADRVELEDMVKAIKEDLASVNVTLKAKQPRQPSSGKTTGDRDPEHQAAPSIEAIERLLALIQHGPNLMRETYAAIMYAGAGMLRAMDTLGRINPDEKDRGELAFVNWAASWTGRNGNATNYAIEKAKWDADWSINAKFSGWMTLCGLAEDLGVSRDDIADISGETRFECWEEAA